MEWSTQRAGQIWRLSRVKPRVFAALFLLSCTLGSAFGLFTWQNAIGRNRPGAQLATQIGVGAPSGFCFSPNGRWFALYTLEGAGARLYMVNVEERVLWSKDLNTPGDSEPCTIAVTNEGRAVVGMTNGGLFLVEEGAIRRLGTVGGSPRLAWSPSGQLAIVSLRRGSATLAVTTVDEYGQEPCVDLKPRPRSSPPLVAISPTGNTVAVLGRDGEVWLWDRGHVSYWDVLPSGTYQAAVVTDSVLVMHTEEGDVYGWSWRQPRELVLCRLPDGRPHDLLLTPAGEQGWLHIVTRTYFASAQIDEWLALGRIALRAREQPPPFCFVLAAGGTLQRRTLAFLNPATRSLQFWFAEDGSIWDTGLRVSPAVYDVALSGDGQRLAYLVAGGVVYEGPVTDPNRLVAHWSWPASFHPFRLAFVDEAVLLVASREGTVLRMQLLPEKATELLDVPQGVRVSNGEASPATFPDAAIGMTVLPDRRVAVASRSGWLRIWNVVNGKLEREWFAGEFAFLGLWRARRPTSIVSCGLAQGYPPRYAIYEWATSGRLRERRDLPPEPVLAYAVAPDDGATAVAFARSGFPVVVYSRAGTEIAHLTGHPDTPTCLTFCKRGRYVAVGGISGWLWVWDLVSRRPILKKRPHGGPILDLAAQGDYLVAASRDGTLTVWSLVHSSSRR